MLLRILVLVGMYFISLVCWAEVDESIKEKIEAGLKKGHAELSVKKVIATPVEGIYYVKLDGGSGIYITEQGDYLFQGELIEIKPGKFVDWADGAFIDDRRQLVAGIDSSTTINYVPEGERKAIMYVFTDADCGYCRKLHTEIPKMNKMGIEVRYLAYPRAGIGSSSYVKMVSAWCAQDPNKAMTQIKSGQKIPQIHCEDNPVASHMEYVEELGISGTPAVFFMDGRIVPGYRSAEDFAKMLGVN